MKSKSISVLRTETWDLEAWTGLWLLRRLYRRRDGLGKILKKMNNHPIKASLDCDTQ